MASVSRIHPPTIQLRCTSRVEKNGLISIENVPGAQLNIENVEFVLHFSYFIFQLYRMPIFINAIAFHIHKDNVLLLKHAVHLSYALRLHSMSVWLKIVGRIENDLNDVQHTLSNMHSFDGGRRSGCIYSESNEITTECNANIS